MVKLITTLCICLIPFISTANSSTEERETSKYAHIEIRDSIELKFFIKKHPSKGLSYQEKIAIYNKVYESAVILNQNKLALTYLRKLTRVYLKLGDLDNAEVFAKIATDSEKHKMTPEHLGSIYNTYGLIAKEQGKYEQAIDYFLESISNYQRINSIRMNHAFSNLSTIYTHLEDLENALKYSKEALFYSQKRENYSYAYNVGWDYNQLSLLYDVLEQRDSSQKYFFQALDLIKELDEKSLRDQELLYLTHVNGVRYFIKRDNFNQALEHLNIAEKYVKKRIGRDFKIVKGEYFLAVNEKEKLLEILETDIEELDSYIIQSDFLKLRINSYEKYGKDKAALESYKILNKIIRDKFQIDRKRFTKFTTAKLENLKKEKQIVELIKKQEASALLLEKQKAYRILSVFLSLFLLLSIWFFYYRYSQKTNFNKKLQQEVLEKTIDIMKSNQKLALQNEELTRFNFIVSHDLKEPIRSIVSFSNLLQRKLKGNPELDEYTNYIIDSGKQLQSLIQDIAIFQGLDHKMYKKEYVDLQELVNNIKKSLTFPDDDKAYEIINTPLPHVFTSRSALFLIFQNLISNGLKYNDSEVPQVSISAEEKEDGLLILFRDNGIGIEKEYFSEIFKMFKRLNPRSEYDGSGIGLSTSSKLIKKIDGHIEVIESNLGQGTCFGLFLKQDNSQTEGKSFQLNDATSN